MSKKSDYKLTKKQKEAISDQLAQFFFDFWTNKQSKVDEKIINRNGKAVTLDSGLLRNFPEKSKVTT